MNVLVTGCAGFIGSSLIDELIKDANYKIIGIDNFDEMYSKNIKLNNMKKFINNPNFTFYEEDITDLKKLFEIFESNKFDAIVHLAAKAGVRYSIEHPTEYVSVNIGGTINILNAMHIYDIKKLVFASSSSVYGNCTDKKFSEDTKNLKPLSPYAQTKKSCEDFIELYTREFGLSSVVLRFFTVFGEKQRPDLAIKKFEKLISKNEPIPVYGDGTTSRDYTYIDDIVQGIISAINYDKTPFEVINLGSEHPITLNDMIKSLEKVMGKNAIIEHLPLQKGDVFKTSADITKAKNLLGYSSKFTFEQALEQFIKNRLA